MKPFLILRVPVSLAEDKSPMRRPEFPSNPTLVGTADTLGETANLVAGLSLGDVKHHYYGLEVKFTGAPDRKTAIPLSAPEKAKPKLVVNKRRRANENNT